MKNKRICCVFNYNPLYRLPIYRRMACELNCDFFFGDSVFQNIQKFNENELPGFRAYLKAKRTRFKGFVWHKGMSQVFKSKYNTYIITGDNYCFINWLIIYYCLLTGKKVLLWTHGLHNPVKGFFHRLFEKLFFRPVSGIFLYGEYALPYMQDIGCKESHLHIIHNSLDTERLEWIYEKTGSTDVYSSHFGNTDPVLLYIGRIQKRKKINLLLNAMSEIHEQGRNLNLVVIGNKEDDETIGSLTASLGLTKNVWFYGACYDERRNAELIYNADVCVCPAEVGLTCIHSLSFGTPVITNDDFLHQMPEYEAIIDGKTGAFYRTDDVQDLARVILDWVGLSQEYRDRVRQTARKTIQQSWSVDYQIGVLKKVISNL